ncbi:hypothetical protein TNCV_1402181 [Trichonephila clavipes]|nr:hypothetical protein TNCV_1402181 [Trichonephila clavipes]
MPKKLSCTKIDCNDAFLSQQYHCVTRPKKLESDVAQQGLKFGAILEDDFLIKHFHINIDSVMIGAHTVRYIKMCKSIFFDDSNSMYPLPTIVMNQTLEEDLKQQPVCHDSPENVLPDSGLDISRADHSISSKP